MAWLSLLWLVGPSSPTTIETSDTAIRTLYSKCKQPLRFKDTQILASEEQYKSEGHAASQTTLTAHTGLTCQQRHHLSTLKILRFINRTNNISPGGSDSGAYVVQSSVDGHFEMAPSRSEPEWVSVCFTGLRARCARKTA